MPSRRNQRVLDGNDIPALAKYIKSDKCKNIIVMLGAGVSTSAGIPDFRSPKTGLYANLARLKLPYPEAVFDVGFFRMNPEPFYTLAHELYPGKFRPTITHSFIRLLAEHGLLYFCFTQNIDTLERRAGIPDAKIIEAHGSFATQRCIECKVPYDDQKMKQKILKKEVPRCDKCRRGLVKPDIVFFGEQLPDHFLTNISAVTAADLLIVMGTSLTVHPFARLADLPNDLCPRVLVNLDKVGSFGSRRDDVVLLGDCDATVEKLCEELGWQSELAKLWAETANSVVKPLGRGEDNDHWDSDEELQALYDEAKKENQKEVEEEVERLAKKLQETMVNTTTVPKDAQGGSTTKESVRGGVSTKTGGDTSLASEAKELQGSEGKGEDEDPLADKSPANSKDENISNNKHSKPPAKEIADSKVLKTKSDNET